MSDTTATKPARRTHRMAREPEGSMPNHVEVTGTENRALSAEQESTLKPASEPRVSKAGQVLAMLQRPEGTSVDNLIALTGWLPHTTRAALTGLRKKGHTIERFCVDKVTYYRIAPEGQVAAPDAAWGKEGKPDVEPGPQTETNPDAGLVA